MKDNYMPRVETGAAGSTDAEQAATILALNEGIPIVFKRSDGTTFGVMLPDGCPSPWGDATESETPDEA